MSWVVDSTATRHQRMSMSGWWFAASASSATRFTNAMDSTKVRNVKTRRNRLPSLSHPNGTELGSNEELDAMPTDYRTDPPP